jgi:hypothetical protein
MTTPGDIHDSSTCDLANGAPCEMCAAAIEYETRKVLQQVREGLSESSVNQTALALPSFADEWELAPLSQTRYTERENAEWWFERGRLAERARMLLEQNRDMREMLRVARERVMR